ncbi:MAG: hemerythrin domain-containing protein [Candidatus Hodarchaeota archaeon]
MPIGPLMIEHRLIERMISLMEEEQQKISERKNVNPDLIDVVVDFIRTYADRTHHGKEEAILFRDLEKKQLSPKHREIMGELIEEHVYARQTVGKLISAKENFEHGDADALQEIAALIEELVEFYPKHIEKEDKHFFVPCMEYFSKKEQDDMLGEFWEFDRTMIHVKYKSIVKQLEERKE